jgi:hypothetical protein
MFDDFQLYDLLEMSDFWNFRPRHPVANSLSFSVRPLWFRKIGSSPDFWRWQEETARTNHFSREG